MVLVDYLHTTDIGEFYGVGVDRHRVVEVLGEMERLWLQSFEDDRLQFPGHSEIRLIELEHPSWVIDILWPDGEIDRFGPAFSHIQKRTIFLSTPLPAGISYLQTLVHELGHWFFDREFDWFIKIFEGTRLVASGFKEDDYMVYSEAVAFYFDEAISGIGRDVQCLGGYHLRGYEIVQRIRSRSLFVDVLYEILSEYKQKLVQRTFETGWV